MEWPKVIVFGADAGAIPHRLSDDLEEERRIFHVAITRCSDEVVVLADQERPSPFLRELTIVAPPPSAASERLADPRPTRGRTRRAASDKRQNDEVGVGDLVSISGGYEGRVVSRTDDEVLISTESGPRMYFKTHEVLKVLEAAVPPSKSDETELSPDDEVLFEALRSWRMETATDAGVPAYVVCTDATLRAIAVERPTTDAALLAVHGIGSARLENYGDDIIDVVSQHP